MQSFTLLAIICGINSQSVTFETIANSTLPIQWSSGISFVYNNQLKLLGGDNLKNSIYSLDLSSIALTDNDTTIIPSTFQNTWQQQTVIYPSFYCCSSTTNYSKNGIDSLSQQWTINGDRIYIAAPDPNSNWGLRDFLIFDMSQNQFLDPIQYNSEGSTPDVCNRYNYSKNITIHNINMTKG